MHAMSKFLRRLDLKDTGFYPCHEGNITQNNCPCNSFFISKEKLEYELIKQFGNKLFSKKIVKIEERK